MEEIESLNDPEWVLGLLKERKTPSLVKSLVQFAIK